MESLVGYRFRPKDEEIISLLNKKNIDPDFSVQTMNEVDIYNFELSDLPRLSAIQSEELVWYFFCAPYYKYVNSKRANRKTTMGYWKLTGRGCKIYAKHSKEVIGWKRFLIFCEDGNASKNKRAEWVMHEFHSHYNFPRTVETQQLPAHLRMTYDTRNHVAENGFLMVEPQQLPSHDLQFDSRNHVAEKTIEGVEHEELANMTSNYRNHVAENIFSTEESQLLPNQLLASDSIIHVAEKIFSGYESQLLPSRHSASHSRNHVAENNYPRVESQQLPSHYLISDFRDQVAEHSFSGGEYMLFSQYSDGLNYSSLPALHLPIDVEDDGFSSCNGLCYNPFSAPINPEQGSFSYSDGFSDCNVLKFQFDDEEEDMNSHLTVQNQYPLQKLDTQFLLAFDSSKSVTHVHVGDSIGADSDTFNAWVNVYSPVAAGDYYIDGICNSQLTL